MDGKGGQRRQKENGLELRRDWMTEEAAISMWGRINWGVKWKVFFIFSVRPSAYYLKGCRFMWRFLSVPPSSSHALMTSFPSPFNLADGAAVPLLLCFLPLTVFFPHCPSSSLPSYSPSPLPATDKHFKSKVRKLWTTISPHIVLSQPIKRRLCAKLCFTFRFPSYSPTPTSVFSFF